jgi:hypothetical protein
LACVGEMAPVLTAVVDSDERTGVDGVSAGVPIVSTMVVRFGREGSSSGTCSPAAGGGRFRKAPRLVIEGE